MFKEGKLVFVHVLNLTEHFPLLYKTDLWLKITFPCQPIS